MRAGSFFAPGGYLRGAFSPKNRFSCRPKLGGALEDLTPAASTTSECRAMLAHPSTELVARAPCVRASCGTRMRSPSGPRARVRQQRRLEVDESRKRDAQTGGAQAPSSVAGTIPFDV